MSDNSDPEGFVDKFVTKNIKNEAYVTSENVKLIFKAKYEDIFVLKKKKVADYMDLRVVTGTCDITGGEQVESGKLDEEDFDSDSDYSEEEKKVKTKQKRKTSKATGEKTVRYLFI